MGTTQSSSIQPYIDGTIPSQGSRDPSRGKYRGTEYLGGYLGTLEGKLKMQKTRFYYVYDGRLYRKRKGNHSFESSSIVCDLRMCDITVCTTKRSSFQITTPAGHYYIFSAPDANDCTRWVLILTEQAKRSLQSHGISEIPQQVRDLLSTNSECADCGHSSPDWASLNLGVFLCVECAYIHHTLGAHISIPRCMITSKECWNDASLQIFRDIGNQRSNSLWEYLASQRTKPLPTSSHEVKEQWIYAKYVCHHFIDRYLTRNMNEDPSKYIFNAAVRGCNMDIVRGIAVGGNVRWRVANDASTVLHAAAKHGHLASCQLLLYLGADPHTTDARNRTALDVATNAHVCELLKQALLRSNSTNSKTRSSGASNASNGDFVEPEAKHPMP